MADEFQFDVRLSHSSKDKAVVRDIAARLKQDGIRVWLDEDQIKPGDSIHGNQIVQTIVCPVHLSP